MNRHLIKLCGGSAQARGRVARGSTLDLFSAYAVHAWLDTGLIMNITLFLCVCEERNGDKIMMPANLCRHDPYGESLFFTLR